MPHNLESVCPLELPSVFIERLVRAARAQDLNIIEKESQVLYYRFVPSKKTSNIQLLINALQKSHLIHRFTVSDPCAHATGSKHYPGK